MQSCGAKGFVVPDASFARAIFYCTAAQTISDVRGKGRGRTRNQELSEAKAFVPFTDSQRQAFAQLIVAFVFGKVELVEARVRLRQPVGTAAILVNVELLWAAHPGLNIMAA